MFGKLLYQYLGCSQDFATVLFFVQGLCERECTCILGDDDDDESQLIVWLHWRCLPGLFQRSIWAA